MKKYIVSAVLALGMLAAPASTLAAGLTSSQIQSILSLLSSFGADSSVIANVNAALTGTSSGGGGGGVPFCHTFSQDLTFGSSGTEVYSLNHALMRSSIDTLHGGDYSSIFDEDTAADVVKFQAKYGIRQTGYVGPMTRAKLNSLYGCSNQSLNQLNQSVQDQLAIARAKGADAAIKSNLSNVRVQAELYYSGSSNNSYTDVCTDSAMLRSLNSIMSANGGVTPACNSSGTAYAVSSPLNSDSTKYWCVDSTGFNGQTTIALGANTACTVIPAASSLTAAKYSGFGDQTVIAGSANVRLGSFTLTAGANEGVNVNAIGVGLQGYDAVINLRLRDSASGIQIGTTRGTLSSKTDFAFPVFAIPASGTKTIDIYGDIKSGSGSVPIQVSVQGLGVGSLTGNSATSATVLLQTITIGSGSLSVSANNLSSSNVIAGSTGVQAGQFRFTAQTSAYTVERVAVKIPSGATNSVASVVLQYKDASGTQKRAEAVLALPSSTEAYGVATFTGLTMYVPANSSANLDVLVSTATITSGATSGAAISVSLDGNNFRAVDSSGVAINQINNGSLVAGNTNLYVRRTLPTLSAVALNSTTLTAGANQIIGRFRISADAAEDVSWGKIAFLVNKSAGVTISSVDLLQGGTVIAGTLSLNDSSFVFLPSSEQQIPAGSSVTYDIRASVSVGASSSGIATLEISIANPSTSAVTNTAANVGVTNTTAPSFVWSDWSDAADHASNPKGANTTDWTNDYLVRGIPLVIGRTSVVGGTPTPTPTPTPTTYTLSVTKAGTGSGTVKSYNYTGLNCGTMFSSPPQTCAYAFNRGLNVELSVYSESGSTFTGWSGACSGMGTCAVTMDAAKSVTATFAVTAPAPTPTITKSIAITSPSAGTSWMQGKTYRVSWTSSDITTVSMVLANGNTSQNTSGLTGNSSSGSGSADFTVPSSFPVGNAQFSLSGSGVNSASVTVTVVAPSGFYQRDQSLGSVYIGPTLVWKTPKCSCDADARSSEFGDCWGKSIPTADPLGSVCYDTYYDSSYPAAYRAWTYKVVPSTLSFIGGLNQTASALNALNSIAQAQDQGPSSFSYTWTRDLQIGSPYTADIKALQTALTKEGVYTGEITGGFYTQTYLAVQAFQRKQGINATGYVGALTREKLNARY